MEEKRSEMNKTTEVNQPIAVQPAPQKSNKGCWIAVVVVLLIPVVLFLCGFASLVVFGFSSSEDADFVISEGSLDKVAVVNIDGVISETSDAIGFGASSSLSIYDVISDIDTALNDPTVKAIILDIESPGGDVVSSDILYRKVMSARDQKPIIAYSGTMAASGGYFVASAADKFIVHQSDMTGSIGVILQVSSNDGLYEKLGIEVVTFTTGDMKDSSQLFDEDPEGEAEQVFQAMIDESYDLFLDSIVAGRGMDRDELELLADGRIYTGRQAVENGLADALGYKEDAIAAAEGLAGISGATIIEYNHPESFFSFLMSKSSISNALGLASIEVPPFGLYYLPAYMQ